MGTRGAAGALACFALGASWPGALPAQGLFVVSQGDGRVLEYDESDGSFAGAFVEPVTTGFQNPGGMAIRPSDGALYVTSTGTGEIWRYTTATGEVQTPAAASDLIQPGGAAFDPSGARLYFLAAESDLSTGTDAVMELVIASGAVSTLATDATANFSAIAVSGSDLYVSDTVGGRVVRFPTAGGSGTQVIGGLASPGQVLFRAPDELLVAESGGDRVLEYHFDGSAWGLDRVVLSAGAGVDAPFGLALAPDGRLTASGQFSDDVAAVDLATLAVSGLVTANAGGLEAPRDVAWSGSTLLVSSAGSNSVIYFDAAGSPTGVVARGLTAPADSGMAFSPLGNLLVGSLFDNDLAEYAPGGAALRRFFDACPTSLASPFDVVWGADGDVYVSCTGSEGVFRFDGATAGPIGFFVTGGSGGLQSPRGLAFGPNGNLFVASGFTGEILEYDGGTGAFLGAFVDDTGNGGGPVDPWGIAFHGGSLFVASSFPNEVVEFDAASGAFVQVFVASGAGGLDGPTALAFGPAGDLYVTSFQDDAVRRYDGATGAFVSTFVASGSGGLDGPIDLAFRVAPPSLPALPATAVALAALAVGAIGARRLRTRISP